ncbi:MAG TPA: alpha/beta hydrolase, partial [Rhizomicrobium sp.]
MVKVKSLFVGLWALTLFAGAAMAEPQPVLLWPDGAPGSEGKTTAETMRVEPPDDQVISNVNYPSLTPYLPEPAKATGAAVIIMPGGGYSEIWITHEGIREAQFLADRGIAAFVLKYRLPYAPGSTYKVTEHSLSDVQRAIRLVKYRAAEWRIDPARVGVMGFSAGGELATLAGLKSDAGDPGAADPIDREG